MRSTFRAPVVTLAIALLAAACGGGAPSQVVGALPTVPGSSAASSGAPGSTACPAAPAPAAQLPGWTSASKAPTVFPTIVNSARSLTCGANRLLFTFVDKDLVPIAGPTRSVTVALYDLGRDPAKVTEKATGIFVWGIENQRGFYVADVTFPEAGVWGAEFVTAVAGGTPETIRMTFDVATSSSVLRVGQAAPASDTPNAASVGGDLAKISTDTNPDPAFYKLSIKEALAAHDPFVVIFATPKFCVSAQCGPTLDRIKPIAVDFPSVTFIHVEPYLLTFQNGSLQPVLDAQGNLQVVPAVNDWGLLSEPWVFVVNRDGIITASFEGVVSVDEIRAAATAVK